MERRCCRRLNQPEFISIIIITLCLFISSVCHAETVSWINPVGGSWSTPGNWSPQKVPVTGDDVTITVAGTEGAEITVDSAVDINSLYLASVIEVSMVSGLFKISPVPCPVPQGQCQDGITIYYNTCARGCNPSFCLPDNIMCFWLCCN